MAKKEVFFLTPAKKQAFFTTSGSFPTFLTSPSSKAFFTTFDASPTFLSSSRSTSFLNTFLSSPTFVTSSKSVAFLTTVYTGTPRDLKPKIGTLEVATDGTFVVVPDATGEYNPAEPNENPGGYNPESEPTEQYRPKRSEVWLWTVYRIRSRSEADGYGKNTQTPSSQAEQGDVDYEYTLTLPTEINEESGEALPVTGLYEIILIAAPNTEDYANYIGNTNLYDIAAQYPGWYVTSVGIMLDDAVANCITDMRYKYLQAVMCGKCDDTYPELYAYYVGMLESMAVYEWDRATEFYEKIKAMCTSDECSCSTC